MSAAIIPIASPPTCEKLSTYGVVPINRIRAVSRMRLKSVLQGLWY